MEHRPDLSIRNTTRIRGHDDSEPSFTKMPVELLTMIAGYLEVDDNGDPRSHGTVSTELKNLRLASRQFAYLPYLLSRFFKDIRLVASAENIKRLDSGSLAPLKAYVKSITFDIPTNGEQKALELANSGKIQEAWTGTLKQLPGATHFIITQQEQEPDTRDIQESVGQAVFNAAVSALVAAGSTIHALHINHVARIVAWPDNKDLEALKLENLHTLTYHPQLPEFEYDEKDKLEECNTHHKAAIATLLSKCRDTLKDLTVETHLYSFPEADTPSLPALEKFYSTSYFKTADFAAFIENSPSLTHLSLFSNHSDNEDWHSIWRAIRYHANRMEIDFTEIPCVDWTELGVHHHTGEASISERGDDPLEDINYSLEMYLSKRGKWNRSCRMWFEQIGSEDEFTENSSGEDGEGGGLSDRSDDETDEDDEDDDDDGNEDNEEGSEREVEGKENEDKDKHSEKSK